MSNEIDFYHAEREIVPSAVPHGQLMPRGETTRDRFFFDVAEQLLRLAEVANRQGYDVGLEIKDPEIYHENNQEYLGVCGHYVVKNINTNGILNVRFIIKERKPEIFLSLGLTFEFKLDGISKQLGFPFKIRSQTNCNLWTYKDEKDRRISFGRAALHVISSLANQSDPLVKTSFRGFKVLPIHVIEHEPQRPALPGTGTNANLETQQP